MVARAIGIDLGTTYSCVGVWQHDRVEIIANYQGNRTTPSYVAFTSVERLVGDAAKNQIAMNPTNTVFDASAMHGPGDKPMIVVQYLTEEKHFAAEEISSMVLMKMREMAEAVRPVPVRAEFLTKERPSSQDLLG
ncbi:Heat shock protein cognate 1 [Nymphaea thermarum]|nr:Heat shock protein cognate 1 [Nymphaea thermarum]